MSFTRLTRQVPFAIPADDLLAVREALKTIHDKLVPHLVPLAAADRKKPSRMGAKSVDFVSNALGYALGHPEFNPGFLAVKDFEDDVAVVAVLRELRQSLKQVGDLIDDSLVLAGSDALAAALAFYQSVKAAARRNMPGAVTIAQDLAARFVRRHAKAAVRAPVPDVDSPRAAS